MRKPSVPVFRPLSPLAVSTISEQGARLQSAREVVELRALAPDLFRIRIAQGSKLSDRPSWAVAKIDWDPVSVEIRSGRREVALQTVSGKLILRLADGFLRLLDSSENELFSTVSKETGFEGNQSRVTLALA